MDEGHELNYESQGSGRSKINGGRDVEGKDGKKEGRESEGMADVLSRDRPKLTDNLSD